MQRKCWKPFINGYGDVSNSKVLKKGYSTLLDKTLYENDTNTSVTADMITEAYANLTYAKKEVVTTAEFTKLTNQFTDAEKEAANAVVGNKKGEYQQATVDAFKKMVETLKSQADESTITKTELTKLSAGLSEARTKFAQGANQKDAEIKPEDEKPNNNTQNTEVSGNGTVTKPTSTVKTGDEEPIGLLGAAGIVSLAVACFLKRRK